MPLIIFLFNLCQPRRRPSGVRPGTTAVCIYCSPVTDVIASHGVQYHQYADDMLIRLAIHADNTSDVSVANDMNALGVVLDRRLTFQKHAMAVARPCNYHS